MKKLVVSVILALCPQAVLAHQYNCELTTSGGPDTAKTIYQFDTSIEGGKFVDVGQGTTVGCLLFRSQPELLTCGLAQGENFFVFTTAENGISFLSLQANLHGKKANLNCAKGS